MPIQESVLMHISKQEAVDRIYSYCNVCSTLKIINDEHGWILQHLPNPGVVYSDDTYLAIINNYAVSTEDKEIKKSLSEADEEVEDKIAKEGGDAAAIKKGMEAKKGTNVEQAEGQKVEDLDDVDHVDENTPNPT